jgi:hypothetical protein
VLAAELCGKKVLGPGPPARHGVRQLIDQLFRVMAHQLPQVRKVATSVPDILDATSPLHFSLEGVVKFKEYNAQAVHVAAAVHLKKSHNIVNM